MGACFSKKKKVSSSSAASSLKTEAAEPRKNNEAAVMESQEIKVEQCNPTIKIAEQKEEENLAVPKKEKDEDQQEGVAKKEVFIIKHRKSHDRERPSPSPPQNAAGVAEVDANSNGAINNVNPVRTSSCTKEEVDAILIQCGRLSRSNSSGKAVSSGRKYSGSKRSYDFDHESEPVVADQELKSKGNDEDEETERRQHRQRHRQSPSKGRRRTPSREREQQQRSGSRERGSSSGGGRRVSRSPGRRSENTQAATSINTANANGSNTANRPAKMVSVPASVSSSLAMDKSNAEQGATKRITVKRNVAETAVAGSRTAASPRSRSPARTNPKGSNENQQQQPSLSRNPSRKAEHSPYRRNPLGENDPSSLRKTEHSPYRRNPLSEIDPNSLQYPQSATGINKKPNAEVNIRGSSNNKGSNVDAKEQHRVDEGKTQPTLTRSRSARRSRDLDINPETLLNPVPPTSYTSLLLEDIQNFHQKNTVAAPALSLPACVSKACSIMEAVADLNSTTSSNLSVGRKMGEGKDPFVDLLEPSFHKYVTVKRGGDMEEQESSGSNSFVSSGQHWGFSSSSWEPNSAESTDRWSREDDGSRERNAIGRGRVVPVLAASTFT
ncbi:hypothetical protein SLA2020_491790 [Shorea laevis]